jgi:diaminopimelate decarboxylase
VIESQEKKPENTLSVAPFDVELGRELLDSYGSPLYVYQGDLLRETIRRISGAVPYAHTQFHFASVTNGNVALLQVFQQAGWGLHANTPGDIYLGLQAGFSPGKIVYTGSNLSREDMQQVLGWGVRTFNLDSVAQVQLFCDVCGVEIGGDAGTVREIPPSPSLKRGGEERRDAGEVRLGLRLNLPEITGDSRIGVRPEEFTAAIAIAKSAGLKLSGLHFYRGTGTNATQAFTQVIDAVIATAQLLPDWEYLDFGGGFGYPYHAGGVAFDWELFGAELTQKLTAVGREIELVIEPGRAVIAGCATLLAQAVSVKWQENKQIVGVDTSITNLAVLSVHGGYREIVTLQPTVGELAKPPHPTDVCGNTTYSRDYLGRNCQLPALQMGDIVVILDVGAYGYAMSSHFLHRPRPAEVFLEAGGHRLIRRREDYSVLLNNQVF